MFFPPVDEQLKTLAANQNPHIKKQTTKLQRTLIINRMLLLVGLYANIVSIVIGVNRPLSIGGNTFRKIFFYS